MFALLRRIKVCSILTFPKTREVYQGGKHGFCMVRNSKTHLKIHSSCPQTGHGKGQGVVFQGNKETIFSSLVWNGDPHNNWYNCPNTSARLFVWRHMTVSIFHYRKNIAPCFLALRCSPYLCFLAGALLTRVSLHQGALLTRVSLHQGALLTNVSLH